MTVSQSKLPAGHTALLPRHGVLVLSGYGLRIAVQRGHLVVEDGIAEHRRRGRFSRVTKLHRLVVLGHAGTVSLEALRWLRDVGAGFIQIDADGRVICAAGPLGLNNGRLRRAQALAAGNGVGIGIARVLIQEKLAGQARVLEQLHEAPGEAGALAGARQACERAATIEHLRYAESQGAKAYWSAWRGVPVMFAQREAKRIPAHWRSFGPRHSILTRSPRKAINPANAMLNYLYAILEAEARLAALAVGLDPAVGVIHADQQSRDSLALDLMEAVRPAVDAFLLEGLSTRTFRKKDFFERRDGMCRVMPPLSELLARTGLHWAGLVAPMAEHVARQLFAAARHLPGPGRLPKPPATSGPPSARPLATPLTQQNRRAGRDAVRQQAPSGKQSQRRPKLSITCVHCGGPKSLKATRCAVCAKRQRLETLAQARTALAERRAAGDDPFAGVARGGARWRHQAAHRLAVTAWGYTHSERPDPEAFRRQILPRLRRVPAAELARATGLTLAYCYAIRSGRAVPHARHWEALQRVTAAATP